MNYSYELPFQIVVTNDYIESQEKFKENEVNTIKKNITIKKDHVNSNKKTTTTIVQQISVNSFHAI